MLKSIIHLSKQEDGVRTLFDGARWTDDYKLVRCGNYEAVKIMKVIIEK